MGLLLAISNVCVPGFIRKRNLEMLFATTAAAFGAKTPPMRGLSADGRLELFAQFTRVQAVGSIRQGNVPEIQSRLFENARKIGQGFRDDFKLDTVEQVMRMSTVICRQLKIDLHGELQGDIEIRSCFFSDYYSVDVCRVISSLDAGLLDGLSYGGVLSFTQRITEGNDCCRAFLFCASRRPL